MTSKEWAFLFILMLVLSGVGFVTGWLLANALNPASNINLETEVPQGPHLDVDPIYMQGGTRWEPEAPWAYEGTVTDA